MRTAIQDAVTLKSTHLIFPRIKTRMRRAVVEKNEVDDQQRDHVRLAQFMSTQAAFTSPWPWPFPAVHFLRWLPPVPILLPSSPVDKITVQTFGSCISTTPPLVIGSSATLTIRKQLSCLILSETWTYTSNTFTWSMLTLKPVMRSAPLSHLRVSSGFLWFFSLFLPNYLN